MENMKTVLAVIGLIAIGFVGGFITHRQMVKQEVQKVSRLGQAPMFLRHIHEIVNPTEEQQKALEPILREHAMEMAKLMRSTRGERQDLLHELEVAVQPILTEEQIERLQHFNRRFRSRKPHPGGKRKPRSEHSNDTHLDTFLNH